MDREGFLKSNSAALILFFSTFDSKTIYCNSQKSRNRFVLKFRQEGESDFQRKPFSSDVGKAIIWDHLKD